MDTQLTGTWPQLDPDLTPLALTERHLHEWLQLLDYMQDTHATPNELNYCRNQVTRLQLEVYKLRNS